MKIKSISTYGGHGIFIFLVMCVQVMTQPRLPSSWAAQQAALPAAAQAEPRAAIDQPVFAFAPVIAGQSVTHIFTIQNTGDADLTVPGVYAG